MPDMNMQTFEEVRRHQLVTEFNVQSQSELVDYQVKLENVDNPTQAQDNLVIGVDGGVLPHWNESVDFDTWVKMDIEQSGKRGLLIHGNDGLSSGSSISDTFLFGDGFVNLNNWNYGAGASISNGTLVLTTNHADITNKNDIGVLEDYIVETRVKTTITGSPVLINTQTDSTMSSTVGYATPWWYNNQNTAYLRVDGVGANLGWAQHSINTWYQTKLIVPSSTNVITEVWDDGTINLLHTANTASKTTNTEFYIGFYYYAATWDWVIVRKYTATEPTVHIGTPKNISTALKSFGRAG